MAREDTWVIRIHCGSWGHVGHRDTWVIGTPCGSWGHVVS